MNDTTNPARRLRHGDRPTAPLRWNDRWTLLLTGPTMGLIGPLGSTWPNQSAEYERVDVCVLREDFPVAVFRRGGEGASSWHKLELISHGTPTDPLRDGEQLYRAGTVPKLESIEQYRMQMAAIGTASFGYWKEGDTIHPDYDTVPLRDVARLFAKYDQLHKFREQVRVMVAMLKNREWAEDLAATGDAAELQSVITELVGARQRELPAILFDGAAVLAEVHAHGPNPPRTSADNVAEVLDAIVRLMRAEQRAAPDAVDAALADAITHGTGAFRVHGDGSTEHVQLSKEDQRHYAELAAFPPNLQRDALYQDYVVPVKEGPKP